MLNDLIDEYGGHVIAEKFNMSWASRVSMDLSQLPGELASRYVKAQPGRREPVKSYSGGSGGEFLAASISVWLFSGFWVAVFGDDSASWTWLLILGNFVLVLASFLGLKAILQIKRADPPKFSRSDRQLLRAAEFKWPAERHELGHEYLNRECLEKEWDTAAVYSGHASDLAAYVWREAQLVGLAEMLCDEIRASRSWRSELLSVHRARIDLEAGIADINCRAHRVWLAHANTAKPRGRGIVAQAVADYGSAVEFAAEVAWDALVYRVLLLAEYLAAIAPIDIVLHDLELLNAATKYNPDSFVQQLHVDAALGEFETHELVRRAQEIWGICEDLAE
ncbi:hypothetical protein GCM10009764_76710 [Nocardia ninae]|uniref:Uncharacterized protein n=2 Tax=Nocardia ninae TaxID=356145 RepID=A0A511MH52_9NOCA|nr:hypothetical protein NN4_44280 [Nocardia ninae NBRC 108245]